MHERTDSQELAPRGWFPRIQKDGPCRPGWDPGPPLQLKSFSHHFILLKFGIPGPSRPTARVGRDILKDRSGVRHDLSGADHHMALLCRRPLRGL